MRFLVLGGGLQGQAIAANLAARADVTDVHLADTRDVPVPADGVTPVKLDALDRDAVCESARGCAGVVTAVPGHIGHRVLANAAATGVPTVDVSFMPETPTDLAARATAPILVDVGLAPGLSHVLAADLHRRLGGLDDLAIHVGGIPQAPPPVFRHAVYFHAPDLLAEYTRPARLRREGADVAPAPLAATVEHLHDPELGALEAFPSDGLRSLLASYPDVPCMREMTLRHPGHLARMRDLQALGLLDPGAVDATARALADRFPAYAHPDRVLMEVTGRHGDRQAGWRLHDVQDAATGLTAMSRTTAYTAAAAAHALAHGALMEPGVHPPERLGRDEAATRALLDDLGAHGIHVTADVGLEAGGTEDP